MTEPMILPDDENGDVLRRMQANGDDLSKPRGIDFTVVLSSEENAKEFRKYFSALGYATTLENTGCVEDLPWDVVVVKEMVPTHSAITSFELELETISKTLCGRNDGWGCFEQ
jgi:hypothetical protein